LETHGFGSKGVYFSSSDLYKEGVNTISIQYTGSRITDFSSSNRLAGYKSTPEGYTWHHLSDYDPATNSGTMQLVKRVVHSNIPHSGGVSQFREAAGLKYDTLDARSKAKAKNCCASNFMPSILSIQ